MELTLLFHASWQVNTDRADGQAKRIRQEGVDRSNSEALAQNSSK